MYKSFSELARQPEEKTDQYQVLDIVDEKQKRMLLSNYAIVCVDVYADWCGPCKQTAPDYAMLASSYNKEGVCILVKESFEKNLTYPTPTGLPTYQFFLYGKRIGEDIIGADIPAVEKRVKELLNHINTSSSVSGPTPNRNTIRNYRGLEQGQNVQETNSIPYMSGQSYYQTR